MEQKVTLKKLAGLLNLSISTVSKSLNDSPEISAQTRSRVKQLALLNNYIPNGMAQSLKANKTKTIGVIIPNILPSFFTKALYGIESTAGKAGYRIIICISNESTQKEAESLKTFLNGRVDGIILSLAKETQQTNKLDHLNRIIDYGIPLVLFDRISNELRCDSISIDDHKIAEKATDEMHESGCRNIIYLSTIFDTSVDLQRQNGYAMSQAKHRAKPFVLHIRDDEAFEEKLLPVLAEKSVDGILAADELSAIRSMRAAIKHGYKIPEDLSVIGFTNGFMGEHFLPSLSTVNQHAEEQGKLAVETLISRLQMDNDKTLDIKNNPDPVQHILETLIIHRESTRHPLAGLSR
ncbi:LacI family DNA-binding transcriptional regulator [Zunongwangia sp. F363]|uniref:LacI family DNA-binding transcriptional regulator n=1 Tax=Autumnicola tepida TaxID=3075595 RepID=A0ABU3CDD0_9FLAO|nr:LacI family DNA-binding transcriptional regulator [Zunongwangia sp. F363]MDT0644347.1 LacI family DNA-binding transcriptional regulator [Zunongwangia sp. F363]